MWDFAFALDDDGEPLAKNRLERYRRKYPEEMNMLDVRVSMLLSALNAGYPVREALNRGWVHPEEGPVFAVDPGRSVLRLYCCLDRANTRIIILTIGEKKRQGADVRDAAAWAREILEQEQRHG